MARHYRIRLGSTGQHTEECLRDGFVGIGYGFTEDLSSFVSLDKPEFMKRLRPVYQNAFPDKHKIAVGQACSKCWMVAAGFQIGDVVLVANTGGHLRIGEIASEYRFADGHALPQQRAVQWTGESVNPSDMSSSLLASCNSRQTIVPLDAHLDELRELRTTVIDDTAPMSVEADAQVAFAMEKHLEEFLVSNWAQTELGREYDLYFDEDGAVIGRQFETDTGPIDILAISKDQKTLLVVELKRGRASDAVVGQTMRYMGFVKGELADPEQSVKGVIVAMEASKRLRRALSMTPDIDFYRFEVSFKLEQGI